ncbi:MAG: pilus assembly protein [Chloroflexi bacterium]|nr:pilus assembly protein [Chloroflexota bacterium]
MVRRLLRWLSASEKGQSIVEFSLTAPFLLVIGLGAADVARATYSFLAVNNAAANGALYASLSASNASNTSGIQTAALANTQVLGNTTPSNPSVSSQTQTDGGGFQSVSITVTYQLETAGWPGVPNPVMISKTIVMRVMQ